MCRKHILYNKTVTNENCFTKSQIPHRFLNAGSLKQQETLDRLICDDEECKFIRASRGSPPYFQKAKKDLFATIRQLGRASLFSSFSSAETQQIHLLILGQLVHR